MVRRNPIAWSWQKIKLRRVNLRRSAGSNARVRTPGRATSSRQRHNHRPDDIRLYGLGPTRVPARLTRRHNGVVRSHSLVPLLLAVVAAVTGTRAAPQIPAYVSHWRASEIVVDGSANEWEGLTTAVTDLKVSLGAANDAEVLRLCLLSDDPGTGELILRRGLIVWFDPAGGTKKVFGLRYPVGTFSVDKPRPSSRGRAAAPSAPPEPIEIVNRVELLGPGRDERRSLLADKVPGIRVKIGQSDTGLTYELEVPLSRTAGRPYGLGAGPGAVVGIGLETPDLEKGVTVTGEPPRGDARGGGWSMGAGGGRAAEPPSSRGREQERVRKPLKWWGTIKLATSGASSAAGTGPPAR